MKKYAKLIPFVIFAIGILGFAVFFIVISSLAPETRDVSMNYKISSYDVNINVNEDNSYDITERITANFSVYKHGIYRYLPIYQTIECEGNGKVYSRNYKIKYTNIDCDNPVEDYIEDDYYILQIGNENTTYIGAKTYLVSYTIEIGDDKITDFDQFYYNIIGDGWDTTISNVSFTVTFDKPITQTKAFLYVGSNAETEVDIVNNSFNYSYSGTIAPFSGVTARVVLDEGYFKVTKASIAPDILLLVAGIALLGFIALWVLKKNNNQPIIPVVEFKAPDNATPADVGYIIDKIVNKKDIASLIVYWANKGFLKIIDDEKDCQLVKLQDPDGTFKGYEADIFNALFNNSVAINLNDTDQSMAVAVNNAKKSIQYENKEKNFSSSRTSMRAIFITVTAFLVFGVFAYLGDKLILSKLSLAMSGILALIVCLGLVLMVGAKELKYSVSKAIYALLNVFGFILIAGIFVYVAVISFDIIYNPTMLSIFTPLIFGGIVYFILKINVRTEEGNKILGHLIGLREFILITEKDRIKMLAKDDPTLFYEILPYAYVLGVSDVWINKFEELIVEIPDWYERKNNNNMFLGYYLLSTMNRTNSFYSRSITEFNANKTNSHGGGFGGHGGGFSGGGFGGGGGGSW